MLRSGTACYQKKIRFGWDFKCKLIQDEGMHVTNQNWDLDYTCNVTACYQTKFRFG